MKTYLRGGYNISFMGFGQWIFFLGIRYRQYSKCCNVCIRMYSKRSPSGHNRNVTRPHRQYFRICFRTNIICNKYYLYRNWFPLGTSHIKACISELALEVLDFLTLKFNSSNTRFLIHE